MASRIIRRNSIRSDKPGWFDRERREHINARVAEQPIASPAVRAVRDGTVKVLTALDDEQQQLGDLLKLWDRACESARLNFLTRIGGMAAPRRSSDNLQTFWANATDAARDDLIDTVFRWADQRTAPTAPSASDPVLAKWRGMQGMQRCLQDAGR